MRRSSSDIDTSLELLLDTMCNTFGGILFLALLICMLIRSGSSETQSPEESDAAIAAIQKQKVDEAELILERQRRNQLQASRNQAVQLVSRLQSSASADAVAQLLELRSRQVQLVANIRGRESEKQHLLSIAADLKQQISSSELKKRDALLAKEMSEKLLASLGDRETVNLRLPYAHVTAKRQIALALWSGRLYVPRVYDEDGRIVSLNHDHLKPSAPDNTVSTNDLRADRGLSIMKGGPSPLAELRRFGKDHFYFCIAVWPDSYKEFKLLRDEITTAGWEYQLLLLNSHDSIEFGPSTKSEVQ